MISLRPAGSSAATLRIFWPLPFLAAAFIAVIALTLPCRTAAQALQSPLQDPPPTSGPQPGRLMGTVLDVNGSAVANATVVLGGTDLADRQTTVTSANGFFQFEGVKSGVPSWLTITATGFANWSSPPLTLASGEFKLLGEIRLTIATQETSVTVTADPVEAATEQYHEAEKQRILGVVPNFYVAYDPHAAPLTTKLKFQLALKISVDPVTVAGIGLIAGLRQAANTPRYGQGAAGFGKRFGSTATDGFTDIMIGGAILPSLLHQDPRYFYQGTGSTKSRLRHALLGPFVARGDNGKYQPNYSTLGGDLAAAGLANLYYPRVNRGAGLLLGNFAIGTAERLGATVAQEFVLGKLTHRGGHIQ